MSTYPNPDMPYDGMTFNWDENGKERAFASVEVTGLTFEQIASLHAQAKAMRCGEIVNHLIGEEAQG